MTNYDIPNEEELQPVSTYNQFIQLRDTFVFSEKKYPGKA